MKIRVKVKCPLCSMTRFTGDIEEPLKLKDNDIELPEIVLVRVTSHGRGKIVNHMVPLQDMSGEDSRADEIELEIVNRMLDMSERLVSLLETRKQEL